MTAPTVHQAISAVVSEMEGVGKTQENREQHYKFRGIDDVLKVLHPLLGKHGVVIAPNVIEREIEERVSKSGTHGTCTFLHVEYTIFGPNGDSFQASTWGEGLDYGDKSTNKAMTAAFKYLLFEVFAVADPEDDGDATTPEEHQAAPARRTRAAPKAGGGEVSPAQLGLIGALFNQKGLGDDATIRHTYASEVIGRPLTSSREMTKAEASKLIDALQAEDDAAPSDGE